MAKEVSSNAGLFGLSMAIVGLVLPISALPFGFIGGITCSLLGFIFGLIQLKSGKNSWGKAAVVVSIIALIGNFLVIYLLSAAAHTALTQLQQSGALDTIAQAGAQ